MVDVLVRRAAKAFASKAALQVVTNQWWQITVPSSLHRFTPTCFANDFGIVDASLNVGTHAES